MSKYGALLLIALSATARGAGEIVVELVPDPPGPYVGGETITVHFWLHSTVNYYAEFRFVQFDFRDSDLDLNLATEIEFDYSTLFPPHGYTEGTRDGVNQLDGPPLLPVPYTSNRFLLFCPPPCPSEYFSIPPNGSFHVASISAGLPTTPGSYRLDVINADDPASYSGAIFQLQEGIADPPPVWRANSGEITGGQLDFVIPEPIPAISWNGLLVLSVVVCLAAKRIIKRRLLNGSPAGAILAAVLLSNTPARSEPLCTEIVGLDYDSGQVIASGGGTDAVLVYSDVVTLESRAWLRIHFSITELTGAGATASFIRLESLLDSEEQIMFAADLEQWGGSSAYFAGDSVLIEVWAFPGMGANRVAADLALTDSHCGAHGETLTGICGEDDRIPIADRRVARLRYSSPPGPNACAIVNSCSGFLYNNQPFTILTAAHCCADFNFDCEFWPVVEFNVPQIDTTQVPPVPISSQYPIRPESVVQVDYAR